MTKKVLIRNIIISLIFICIVFAPSMRYATVGEIVGGAQDFLNNGEAHDDNLNQETLKNASNIIYNVFLAVGIVVAVIVASILGIQFMIASAEDKAEVKKALVPFVIGCIVVFGAFGIWKVALGILS